MKIAASAFKTLVCSFEQAPATPKRWILAVLYILPVAITTFFVFSYGVNVPIMDQWGMPDFYRAFANGTWDWKALTAQHNEHRIAVPRLLFTALAFPSSWNVRWELSANLLLALLTGLLLINLCQQQKSIYQHQSWLIWQGPNLLTFCLVFSLLQHGNWLWGFQLLWFLINFLLVTAVWLLYLNFRGVGRGLWLLTLLPCVLASFTAAHGLLTWLAIAPGLLVYPGWRAKILRVGGVTPIFLICVYAYLSGYSKPGGHPSLGFIFENPIEAIKYYLSFLGSALFPDKQLAFLCGGVFILVLGFVLWQALRPWAARKQYGQSIAPWLSLALFSLLFAGLITIGRAGFGVDQALSSRYRTSSILLVIALIQMMRLWISLAAWPREDQPNVHPQMYQWVSRAYMGGVAVCFLIYFITSFEEALDGPHFRRGREVAQMCLELAYHVDETYTDSARTFNHCKSHLFPSMGFVKAKAPILDELQFHAPVQNITWADTNLEPIFVADDLSSVILPDVSKGETIQLDIEILLPAEPIAKALQANPFVMLTYNDRTSLLDIIPVQFQSIQVQEESRIKVSWNASLDSGVLPQGPFVLHGWMYDEQVISLIKVWDSNAFEIR